MARRSRGPVKIPGKNGSWQWGANLDNQRYYFHTQDENLALEMHAELILARPKKPAEGTVGGVIAAYLAAREKEVAVGGLRRSTLTVQRYRLQRAWQRLANRRVVDFRPEHVYEALADPEKTAAWRHHAIRELQTVFRWWEQEGRGRNPLKGCKRPKMFARKQIWSDAELDAAMEHASREFAPLVQFVRLTGSRAQEVVRIEARHCDWERGLVTFPPAEAKGGLPRTIFPATAALQILRRQADQYPSGPVFRNSLGRPWNASSICAAFARIQEQTGGERIRLTDLRHTWYTKQVELGVHPAVLAVMAGHRDLREGIQTYSQIEEAIDFMRAQAEKGALAPAEAARELDRPSNLPGENVVGLQLVTTEDAFSLLLDK